VASITDFIAAAAPIAIYSRSHGSCSIRQMKPRFWNSGPPSRWSVGT
jgi:hypothetical protein